MTASVARETDRKVAAGGQGAKLAPPRGGGIPAALRDGVVDGVAQALRLDSGRPGPHAVIVAIVHGNETCGLAAMRALLADRRALERGRITMIAANVAGHAARIAGAPQAGRFVDEDMNRVWTAARLDGGGADTVEMRRARAIAPLCRAADLLIDLHSMATAGPRLLMFHDTPAARALLPELPHDHHRIRFEKPVHDGRLLIEQPGVLGDARKAAFVVECGVHGKPATDAYARRITRALLAAAGLIAPVPLRDQGEPAHDIRAVEMLRAESDSFRFLREPGAVQRFEAGEPIAEDGSRRIVAPYAPTYLLLPRRRPRRGQEAGLLGRD